MRSHRGPSRIETSAWARNTGGTLDLAYSLLNVFAVGGDPFSGNPLCVFEDGRGLTGAQMQALARQFRLSETTFVLPAEQGGATARVRIFTPDVEMPFAGHPTLGTAHVVRTLTGAGDRVMLEMPSGLVEVKAVANRWTLRAPRAVRTRVPTVDADTLARMVGLAPGAVSRPLWVDTGTEQLVLHVRSVDELRAAATSAEQLTRDASNPGSGPALAYLFADLADGHVESRAFFVDGGGVTEDPATGSACANLGGWLIATGATLPLTRHVHQGGQVARPSLLRLDVDEVRDVRVSGEVRELGRGVFRL